MKFRHKNQINVRKNLQRDGVVRTLVPGQDPIELVAFYEEFLDYYPKCEMQTKRWFLENVQEDWVSLDVGANVGYHSILIAKHSPFGKVFAFEPTETFEMLCRNLDHNNVRNVVPVKRAVSNTCGVERAPIYRIWGHDPDVIEVDFVTVDQFVEEAQLTRVDLIKVDVDGFDVDVLRGAKKTLDKFSPTVIVELNHALATRGQSISEALDWMLERKYSNATIVDADNYVFTKDWQLGQSWPNELRIRVDRRDPLRYLRPVVKPSTRTPVVPKLKLHNDAVLLSAGVVEANGPSWSYVASFGLPPNAQPTTAVEVVVRVEEGDLGVFVSDEIGSKLLCSEVFVKSGESQRVVLAVPILDQSQVILRKTTQAPLKVVVLEVNSCEVESQTQTKPLLSSMTREELGEFLDVTDNQGWSDQPLSVIEVVNLTELRQILGFKEAPRCASQLDDFHNLLMERNDAPILEWIFRNLSPSAHFEFGTWEGFGTLLVLRTSNAEVWTINLPEGEEDEAGPRYLGSREPNHPERPRMSEGITADASKNIGWMYRASGFEARVHQIFADSTIYDFSELCDGGFSSVLIDGGHSREVVLHDQRVARKLLSERGILIWHDFSLNPLVVEEQSSCRGVSAAVADDAVSLTADLRLFWIRDSMLLVGLPHEWCSRVG